MLNIILDPAAFDSWYKLWMEVPWWRRRWLLRGRFFPSLFPYVYVQFSADDSVAGLQQILICQHLVGFFSFTQMCAVGASALYVVYITNAFCFTIANFLLVTTVLYGYVRALHRAKPKKKSRKYSIVAVVSFEYDE